MLDKALHENITKIILSAPIKNVQRDGRSYIKVNIVRGGSKFQASMYTKTQVFHKNFAPTEVAPFVEELFGTHFTQLNSWCNEFQHSARITKKGKILTSTQRLVGANIVRSFTHSNDNFDRQKNYIIEEGANIPALHDMGVFTSNGKIAAPMRDKFRQINRFLELIADEVKPGKIDETATINIIDFGCGKSYLTFVMYHYFTQVRRLKVNICGLDLMADVIEKCNTSAQKYGYSELEFKVGDVGSMTAPPVAGWGGTGTFNIVICLHACDTATDRALFNAIQWNADLICAVPCCQKELNTQINSQTLPILTEYGIIKERMAALATDAIRAKLLEYMGYKTQVLEFVGMETTPKNLFIRARRTSNKSPAAKNKAMNQIQGLVTEFSFEPTLLTLINHIT